MTKGAAITEPAAHMAPNFQAFSLSLVLAYTRSMTKMIYIDVKM